MDNSNIHRSLERQHEAGAYSNGMSLNSLYTMSDYVSPYTTQAPLFGKAVDPQNRPAANELGGFPNMDYARHYIPRSEHSDINSFRNYIMSRIEQPDFLTEATKRVEHNGDKLAAPYTSGYAHSYPNPKDTYRSMTSISDHLQGYGMNCKQQPDYISNGHAGFLGGINYNSMYDMPGELMHPQVPQAQVIRVPQQDEHIPNNSGLISPKQKLLGLSDLSQNDSGNKNVLPPPLLPPQQHMVPQKNQTLMGCFTGVPTLPTSDISSNIMDVNSSSMLLNVSTPSSATDKMSSPSMSMCNNVSSSGSAVKTPPGFDSLPILSPSVYPPPPVNKLNDETNITEEQQEKSMPPPDVKEETNKEPGRDDQASTMSDDTIIAKDEDIGKVDDENEMETCVNKTNDYSSQTVEEPDSSKSSVIEETSKMDIEAVEENNKTYPALEVENSRDSTSELRQLVQEKTAIENKTETTAKEEMKDLDPEKQFALAFKQAQAANMKATAETAKKNTTSQEFDAQEEFIPSMVEDMPGMVYQCHLCSYSGTSRFHFNSHMNTHFDHKCSLCDYTSRTEARLKKHIREYHADLHPETVMSTRVARTNNAPPKQKIYRCKQCDFAATSKNDFWDHSRTHIKADKMLSCPKCNFVTEYKHHLEYHLRNHFGSKPFKCNKCNYSCVNKSMLNSHMKSHSNFYQYRCQDCTYATKYCHSLKLHLRKYNHKPATVLSGGDMFVLQNPDFLLGRRGPRGPKKKMFGLPEIPPLINGVMTHPAHFGFPMHTSMNGIPPNLLGSFLLHRPPLGQQRELSSPPVSSASGMMKCALCDFTTSHLELLNRHVLMHAAAENQDLCKLYGISSETIMAETKHTPSSHHLAIMAQEGQLSPGEICRWNKSASTSPTTTENSSLPQQGTGSIYKNVDGVEKARVLDLSCNVDAESSIQEPVVSGMVQPNQKADVVVKDEYIKDKVETSLPSQSESQVQSSSTSVSPPRNRRKGKAYKLDRICMKLQKQFSPAGESGDGYSSDSCGAGQFGNDTDMMEDDSILSKSELEPGERLQEQEESDYNAKVMTTSNNARDSGSKSQAPYPDFTSLYQSNRWGLGRPDLKNPSMNTNHHAPEAYVCSYCEISFKNCIMYTMHMGYHGYQDPFKCNMCGHPCEDKVSFFLHIARAAHM